MLFPGNGIQLCQGGQAGLQIVGGLVRGRLGEHQNGHERGNDDSKHNARDTRDGDYESICTIITSYKVGCQPPLYLKADLASYNRIL